MFQKNSHSIRYPVCIYAFTHIIYIYVYIPKRYSNSFGPMYVFPKPQSLVRTCSGCRCYFRCSISGVGRPGGKAPHIAKPKLRSMSFPCAGGTERINKHANNKKCFISTFRTRYGRSLHGSSTTRIHPAKLDMVCAAWLGTAALCGGNSLKLSRSARGRLPSLSGHARQVGVVLRACPEAPW